MKVARTPRKVHTAHVVTLRRAGPVVLWLAVLVGVLLGAGAVGHGALAAPALGNPASWSGWLADRTPAAAAMAVVRLVVLGLTWYLLVATVVAVAVRLVRAGRLVPVVDVVTVPFVRSLVQAALGVGVVVASFGPVAAVDAVPVASSQVLQRPLPASEPPVLRELDPPAPPARAAERTWTVAPGQHLWSISAEVLSASLGRPPAEGEVAPYWQQVVEANRARLADPANPDLLFPGQVLVLPAP
jgi:hypothetical protein